MEMHMWILFCIFAMTYITDTTAVQEYENVALRGVATQASLYGHATAPRAIDGNRESNFHLGSCSSTDSVLSPWWRLDLLQKYIIQTVSITNRGDDAPERINGAEIRFGSNLGNNGNSNARCAVINSIPAGATSSFNCSGWMGRYVNVVIPGRVEYLTLCEVEVYGSPV
ncbi:fucolectin [Paramisgurnus dabryanus]|uniref:fucolectin n=1 Tax=Paramisgurnus dabryanus TaxID=90735 RepID=UPI0031F41FDA